MRRSLVRESLLAADAEERHALVCAVLERRPPQRGSAVDPLRDALQDVLVGRDPERGLPYAMRRQLYEAALARNEEALLALLRSGAACDEGTGPGLPREIADIPLGRRRSLARGADPDLLEKLARDPDPIVVRHLLANPRLREQDVVRMAVLRPAVESTLVEIHRHPRWSHRTRVRVALARNPGCPPDVATRALGGIPLAELRDMAADHTLPPGVRRSVDAELARRDPPHVEGEDRDADD